MATLNIEARTAGMQQAQDAFDKLGASEQRAIVAGSALGKQLDSHKKHKDVFGEMAKGAVQFAGALGIATSAQGLLSAGVEKLERRYERLIQLQQEAAGTQQTFADAYGAFLANNPTEDPKVIDRIKEFALREGSKVRGGATAVLQGMTGLRSGAPEGSEAEQLDAMRAAIQQRQIDPNTDLAQYAIATLKIQKGLGISGAAASNVLSIFGSVAAGDIKQLAGSISGLGGVTGRRAPLDDVMALMAFGTTALGDPTGTRASTSVRNAVTKLTTTDVRVGGKIVPGENFADRLLAGVDMAKQAKDPERELAAFAKQLGEGAEIISLVGSVARQRDVFVRVREKVRSGRGGTENLGAKMLSLKLRETEGQSQQEVTTAEGNLTVGELLSPEGEWARAQERVNKRRSGMGLLSQDSIQLGWFQNLLWGEGLRKQGLLTPEGAEASANLRMAREMAQRAGGSPEQVKAVGDAMMRGGESEAYREFLRVGLVNMDRDLTGPERRGMFESGITAAEIRDLLRLQQEQGQAAFVAALQQALAPYVRPPAAVPVNAGEVAP